jgi:hypothetical protein
LQPRWFSWTLADAGIVVAALIPLLPGLIVVLAAIAIVPFGVGVIAWFRNRPRPEPPLDAAAKAEIERIFASTNGFYLQPHAVGASVRPARACFR